MSDHLSLADVTSLASQRILRSAELDAAIERHPAGSDLDGCVWEEYDGAGECGLPLSPYANKTRRYCEDHLREVLDELDADDDWRAERDSWVGDVG